MNQLTIKNLVKTFTKNFSLLITEASLYPALHPSVQEQTMHTFAGLQKLFEKVDDLYIDIAEHQFVFDGIPLYELKQFSEKTIQLLELRKIKCIYFASGLTAENLFKAITRLIDKTLPKEAAALQEELVALGVKNIVFNSKSSEAEGSAENILPVNKLYAGSIEANKLIYSALQTSNTLPMDVVDTVSQNITDMVIKNNVSSLAFTSLQNYDEYTFTHSANVAILSVALAANVIDDAVILKNLARAAFLHDIGKTKVPLAIINKPAKLTEEEWQIIKCHPLFGVKILEQQAKPDTLSIFIALEHHMKYDLSGYPNIKGIEALHPLSLIVTICDVYDAITSKRSYKKSMAADKVLSIMMRCIGCDFDPQFFKLFAQMIGVYPPGTFVRLTTQEIAIVQKVYPQALLLPEVKIVLDASGDFVSEPIILNLSDRIKNVSGDSVAAVIDPEELGIDPLKVI
ncbi:MAG: HD domain-containing phosphohydrolase [Candidatus Omnitrophota bacterium]